MADFIKIFDDPDSIANSNAAAVIFMRKSFLQSIEIGAILDGDEPPGVTGWYVTLGGWGRMATGEGIFAETFETKEAAEAAAIEFMTNLL